MAHICDELLPSVLQLLQLCQIMKHKDCAISAPIEAHDGRAVDLQPTLDGPRDPHLLAQHLIVPDDRLQKLRNFVQAQCFKHGARANVCGTPEKARKGLVCKLDATTFVKDQQSFGHAVEQCGLLSFDLGGCLTPLFLQHRYVTPMFVLKSKGVGAPPKMQNDKHCHCE